MKNGNEHIDEMAKEATLNYFFDKHPKSLTDDELLALVNKERVNKSLFVEKRSSK